MLLPIVDEVGNIIMHQSIAEDSWGHGNYVYVLVFVCVCVLTDMFTCVNGSRS